jgi:hypothetical protein
MLISKKKNNKTTGKIFLRKDLRTRDVVQWYNACLACMRPRVWKNAKDLRPNNSI